MPVRFYEGCTEEVHEAFLYGITEGSCIPHAELMKTGTGEKLKESMPDDG